ncbi:4994_t:CDS:2 [Racocetra fulgida]|uniref:Lysosomal dipeptide transporter MFSD1 n=1 Tax=Racocetra fulgida TaxID=60492 RepID=A0A9N8VFS2_9GLOM|nr:4994_t:CDS:2 [Racocetra fulgida]
MSSNPFYVSENDRDVSTNEQRRTALSVHSSIELADKTYKLENNEINALSKDDDKPDIIEESLKRPLKYKILALICTLSLSSMYVQPLKATVKKELGITNTQYEIVQSSVTLVNTILPILGGVFIDKFGTSTGSILATSLIAVGNILVALSTSLVSFPVMVFGRILYGIGSGTIVTVQTTILSHWFKEKGLSIVVGIQIATSRLSSFLGNLTVVPIKDATGFYDYVGTGLGIAKSCTNIGSTILEIAIGKLQDLDGGEYNMVMDVFLVISIIAVFISVLLLIVARKWNDGILDMKEDKRREYCEEILTKHDKDEQKWSYNEHEAHAKDQ